MNIEKLDKKLSILERRRDHLRQRLVDECGTVGSLAFDREELEALEAAICALENTRAIKGA